MSASPIVIVGAGQAGLQAAASLREAGYDGSLSLVGAEPHLPYERPPLSKQFLAHGGDPAGLVLRAADFYESRQIDLRLGTAVTRIERSQGSVLLTSGERLPYGRLILALGSTPRRLGIPGAGHPGVLVLRTLDDAAKLRARLEAAFLRVVAIGSGFIGLEVAAAARAAGHDVTVIGAQDRVLARAVSEPVSRHLARLHRDQGVDILLSRRIEAVEARSSEELGAVRLHGGEAVPADLVVAGIGVAPQTALAERAGLAVEDGILVDEWLRTSDRRIYAIGDCARFPSPHADGPVRLESVQNAVDQARCVAEHICQGGGANSGSYTAVPWFWTDQYSDKLQIAGITRGHDRIEVVGDPAEGGFSVRCFRAERLLGVESVNRPVDHIRARRQLAELGQPVRASAPRAA